MAQWMIWLVLAGVVTMLELFSGTFYLLMIAIGLGVGALAAFVGVAIEMQLIVAATVGVLCTIILRRSRFGKPAKADAARDPNINLDINQAIDISTWSVVAPSGTRATARVLYRGAQWDVELGHDGQPEPGRYVIREIQGSRLIVSSPR